MTSAQITAAATARRAFRDDGGSTPYPDPTGETAVWNLLHRGIPLPGNYVLQGPHGLTIHLDEHIAAIWLSLIDTEPTRSRKALRAELKKKAPASSCNSTRGDDTNLNQEEGRS